MSEYKKKKFNKKPLKTRENFDNRNKEILMRSNKSKASGENFNIVKGTKKQSLFKILFTNLISFLKSFFLQSSSETSTGIA